MGPLEEAEGDKNYSAAVNVASAPVGMSIPPSNTTIVYSTVAGSVSISALFMAGYVPWSDLGLGVIILATITAKKLGYRGEAKLTAGIVLKTFWQAIPSLLTIVIVIGGILLWCVHCNGRFRSSSCICNRSFPLFYGSIKIKDIPRIVLTLRKSPVLLLL